MVLKNTPSTYGSISKFIHWLIFLLIFALFTVGITMINLNEHNPKLPLIFDIHKLVGLSVLGLMVLRLLWISLNVKPSLPLLTPRWEKLAERFVHILFYILLFAMPLSGWLTATAAGYPPELGPYAFPMPWVVKNKHLSDIAGDIHLYIAWILGALIVVHVAAAFKHYFFNKDNVLQTMWPGKMKTSGNNLDKIPD